MKSIRGRRVVADEDELVDTRAAKPSVDPKQGRGRRDEEARATPPATSAAVRGRRDEPDSKQIRNRREEATKVVVDPKASRGSRVVVDAEVDVDMDPIPPSTGRGRRTEADMSRSHKSKKHVEETESEDDDQDEDDDDATATDDDEEESGDAGAGNSETDDDTSFDALGGDEEEAPARPTPTTKSNAATAAAAAAAARSKSQPLYCLCQKPKDSSMIPCALGTQCGGFIHPGCLSVTPAAASKRSFKCELCIAAGEHAVPIRNRSTPTAVAAPAAGGTKARHAKARTSRARTPDTQESADSVGRGARGDESVDVEMAPPPSEFDAADQEDDDATEDATEDDEESGAKPRRKASAAAPAAGRSKAKQKKGEGAAPVRRPASMPEKYCICQRAEVDQMLMLECRNGQGGCNGWVHAECVGLRLPPSKLAKLDYTCPLCEHVRRGHRKSTFPLPAIPVPFPGAPRMLEKLVAHRTVVKEPPPGAPPTAAPKPVQEYLVKWKDMSYRHCTWHNYEELQLMDAKISQRLQRFNQKRLEFLEEFDEENEPFDPNYVEVERILASTDMHNDEYLATLRQRKGRRVQDSDEEEESDAAEEVDAVVLRPVMYLVKWAGLQYAEATWETEQDLSDTFHILEFKHRHELPPLEERKTGRPTSAFQPLKVSPEFGDNLRRRSIGLPPEPIDPIKLRPYQLEGVNWLLFNWYSGRSCILADEMGLGKTLQSIAFLYQLWKAPATRARGPFLIVAPLSTLPHWQSEIETFTDMNCILYHGSKASRQLIEAQEFHFTDKFGFPLPGMYKFHILITTYEIILAEQAMLGRIKWRALVVDEAHRLKNRSSKLSEAMLQFNTEHSVLLTGTPIQNNTEELWALLHFLDRKAFRDQADFMAKFGTMNDASQVVRLHEVLRPYLLRRRKEDVETKLPPKEETIIEVELTTEQKRYYRAIYERNTKYLMSGTNRRNVPCLINVMMELRKCCNHPYLNRGAEELLTKDLSSAHATAEHLISCSGKMVLLDKLLPKIRADGQKVLIFSQMVVMLDLIEDMLRMRKYSCERLDGRIQGNQRQAAIERFVDPKQDKFIMLLSTRAGGLGLNLTAANVVIIFDSDWNPQNDLQAQARVHRIGQKQAVKIYRLVTRNTYEMQMFHRASLKLGLDHAVMNQMRADNESKNASSSMPLTAEVVEELLKRGAYDVFKDEDGDDTSRKFCEDDIDAILQRSTRVLKYSGGSEPEDVGQNSFSKASFVSASSGADVDINDPDFWTKVIGLKAQPDDDMGLTQVSRTRKKVVYYGMAFDGPEFADDDEEYNLPTSGARPRESRGVKPWSGTERDRTLRIVKLYGYGRWGRIIRVCGFKVRSEAELGHFGRIVVLSLFKGCFPTWFDKASLRIVAKPDDLRPHIVSHLLSRVARDGEPSGTLVVPECLSHQFFTDIATGSGCLKILERLHLLFKLSVLITDAALAAAAEAGMPLPPAAASAAAHGGDAHAHDSDPEADGGGAEHAAADNTPGSPNSKRFKSRPVYVVDDEYLYSIPIDLLEAHIMRMIPPSKRTTAPKVGWWTERHDAYLLLGVFLHGYNKFELMRDDPRLVFRQDLLKETGMTESPEPVAAAAPTAEPGDGVVAEAPGAAADGDISMTPAAAPAEAAPATPAEPAPATSAEPAPATSAEPAAATPSEAAKATERPVLKTRSSPPSKTVAAGVDDEDSDYEDDADIEYAAAPHAALNIPPELLAGLWPDATTLNRHLRRILFPLKGRPPGKSASSLAASSGERTAGGASEATAFRESVAMVSGGSRNSDWWDNKEKQRFWRALCVYGAPDTVAEGIEDDKLPCWQLTWKRFVDRSALSAKTATHAETYYARKFLPHCVAVAAANVEDRASADPDGPLPNKDVGLRGIRIIDPDMTLSRYGAYGKALAKKAMDRLELFRGIRRILGLCCTAEEPSMEAQLQSLALPPWLDTFLHSTSALPSADLPTWWCPWVHDVPLLLFAAYNGLANLTFARSHASLPFNFEAVIRLIASVFAQDEMGNIVAAASCASAPTSGSSPSSFVVPDAGTVDFAALIAVPVAAPASSAPNAKSKAEGEDEADGEKADAGVATASIGAIATHLQQQLHVPRWAALMAAQWPSDSQLLDRLQLIVSCLTPYMCMAPEARDKFSSTALGAAGRRAIELVTQWTLPDPQLLGTDIALGMCVRRAADPNAALTEEQLHAVGSRGCTFDSIISTLYNKPSMFYVSEEIWMPTIQPLVAKRWAEWDAHASKDSDTAPATDVDAFAARWDAYVQSIGSTRPQGDGVCLWSLAGATDDKTTAVNFADWIAADPNVQPASAAVGGGSASALVGGGSSQAQTSTSATSTEAMASGVAGAVSGPGADGNSVAGDNIQSPPKRGRGGRRAGSGRGGMNKKALEKVAAGDRKVTRAVKSVLERLLKRVEVLDARSKKPLSARAMKRNADAAAIAAGAQPAAKRGRGRGRVVGRGGSVVSSGVSRSVGSADADEPDTDMGYDGYNDDDDAMDDDEDMGDGLDDEPDDEGDDDEEDS